MRSLGDDEVLSLPIAVAAAMSDDDLHAIFCEMVLDIRGSMGDDTVPEGFPSEPHDMSRDEILAAVRKYPYWFNYHGGHLSEPSE